MISNLALRTRQFPQTGMLAAALLALAAGPVGAANIASGATVYSTHCAVCHGAGGNPVMPGAPNFRRMETLMQPDGQLLASIRKGKGTMPGFYGILKDQQILDVVAYLRTLS